MLRLLQSITFESILKTGFAIALVASLFFYFLNMGKKIEKEVEKYDFEESEMYD